MNYYLIDNLWSFLKLIFELAFISYTICVVLYFIKKIIYDN